MATTAAEVPNSDFFWVVHEGSIRNVPESGRFSADCLLESLNTAVHSCLRRLKLESDKEMGTPPRGDKV